MALRLAIAERRGNLLLRQIKPNAPCVPLVDTKARLGRLLASIAKPVKTRLQIINLILFLDNLGLLLMAVLLCVFLCTLPVIQVAFWGVLLVPIVKETNIHRLLPFIVIRV